MTAVSWADRPTNMIIDQGPERFDVVVIGGSQAGLAAGYHLSRYELRFVIIDAYDRIGDAWRTRWDSLRLFTPAKVSALPGIPLPGPPHAYPTKDEVADYLETYADRFNLPVRTGIEARRVSRSADDRWVVATSGPTFEASAVVIATGAYHGPVIPEWASAIDPDIRQMHAADYRNPSQYQPGSVLVVGASLSGAEIAAEAARHHRAILAGRDTGLMPIRPGQGVGRFTLPLMWFVLNRILTVGTPMGRRVKPKIRSHGAPLPQDWRDALATAGVERITERVTGTHDGKPMLADGRVLDVRNVVWSTGFHAVYSWVEGLTYGDDGYPNERYGIATDAPGLYFVGLNFQRSFASSLVGGVGRDAEIVADHIAKRARHTA
jgi:putative flavoprotein involved in K+ transport